MTAIATHTQLPKSPGVAFVHQRRDSLLQADAQRDQANSILRALETDYESLRKEVQLSEAQSNLLARFFQIIQANPPIDQLLSNVRSFLNECSSDPEVKAFVQGILERIEKIERDRAAAFQAFRYRVDDLNSQRRATQDSLSDKERQFQQLQSELSRVTNATKEDDDKLAALKREMYALQERRAQLHHDLETTFSVSDTESRLQQLRDQLRDLERTHGDLSRVFTEADQRVTAARHDYDSANQRVINLEDKLRQAESVLARINDARNTDEAAMERSRNVVREVERLLPGVTNSLAEIENRQESLRQDFDRSMHAFKLELNDIERSIPQSENRLGAIRTEIEMLQSEEQSIVQSLSDRRNRLATLSNLMQRHENEFNEKMQGFNMDELTQRQAALRRAFADESDILRQLEAQRGIIDQETRDTQNLIASIRDMINAAREDFNASRRVFENAERELNNLVSQHGDEIMRNRGKIEQLKRDIPAVEEQLRFMRSEHDRITNVELRRIDAEIDRLKPRFDDVHNRSHSSHVAMSKIEHQMNDLRNDYQSLSQKLQMLVTQLNELPSSPHYQTDMQYVQALQSRLQEAINVHERHRQQLTESLNVLSRSLETQRSILRESESLASFVVISASEDSALYEQQHTILEETLALDVPVEKTPISESRNVPSIERIGIRGAGFALETVSQPSPVPLKSSVPDISSIRTSYEQAPSEPQPISSQYAQWSAQGQQQQPIAPPPSGLWSVLKDIIAPP